MSCVNKFRSSCLFGGFALLSVLFPGLAQVVAQAQRACALSERNDVDANCPLAARRPAVRCFGRCSDIAGRHEGIVGPEDFIAAILSCGTWVADTSRCLDETFTSDGFAGMDDASYWDWLEALPALRQCGMHGAGPAVNGTSPLRLAAAGGCQIDAPLLIAGKRYVYDPYDDERDFLKDGLLGLDPNCNVVAGPCTWGADRLCSRLAADTLGNVYQLHVTEGLVRIADGRPVLKPMTLAYDGNSVNIGWSQQSSAPPIQDVAFDSLGNAYVVPVVVTPDAGPSYRAAARVRLGETPTSAHIVQVYGSSLSERGAYEIEVDGEGRVYVLDKRHWMDSRLLKFNPSGELIAGVDVNSVASIRTPTAFHVSTVDPPVLIGACCPSGSSVVFLGSNLNKVKEVVVRGMDYITCITHDPGAGDVWVAGFAIPVPPSEDDVLDGSTLMFQPDYRPMLARIPRDGTGPMDAACVSDYTSGANDYLALPLSMIWTAR